MFLKMEMEMEIEMEMEMEMINGNVKTNGTPFRGPVPTIPLCLVVLF